MKEVIDGLIDQYGQENAPPPWSIFTMPNDVGPGNMHIVQKVFEGPFEVNDPLLCHDVAANRKESLTLSTLQAQLSLH